MSSAVIGIESYLRNSRLGMLGMDGEWCFVVGVLLLCNDVIEFLVIE
jgi:hypothetical protein